MGTLFLQDPYLNPHALLLLVPVRRSTPLTHAYLLTNYFIILLYQFRKFNKALQELDKKKSTKPDKLDPFFLKLAADFIAKPLSYIFN